MAKKEVYTEQDMDNAYDKGCKDTQVNIRAAIKKAYLSGIIEYQLAKKMTEKMPALTHDFNGLANAYADEQVKKLKTK